MVNIYHHRQKKTFYFSDVYNKAQKLDNTIQVGAITGHAES